jgi:hypothetical protein
MRDWLVVLSPVGIFMDLVHPDQSYAVVDWLKSLVQ